MQARTSESRRRSRSEEHTSELQSQSNLVCRLLLEKKRLRHAVVEDPEILFLETGDDVSVLRGGDYIQRDDRNINGNSDAGLGSLLRRVGCLGRIGILLLLCWRRSAALRAGGGLGESGILSQRQDQNGCQSCEQNCGKNGLHRAPPIAIKICKLSTTPQSSLVATMRVNLRNPTAMPKPSAHTCMLV